jgi:hypothetical protein
MTSAGLTALVAPLLVWTEPASAAVYRATTREDFEITAPFGGATATCTVQDDASHDTDAHTATVTGSVPGVCGGLEYEMDVSVSAKDQSGQVHTVSNHTPNGQSATLTNAYSAVTTTVTVYITDFACGSNCSHTVHANPK